MDVTSGERLVGRNPSAFIEYYRADQTGQIAEAPQFRAVRRESAENNGLLNDNPLSALFNFFERGPSRRSSFQR
jgi:hypothetical protein